ncbi:hypothetical protein Tco_1348257 [Tanacetum coccineum]
MAPSPPPSPLPSPSHKRYRSPSPPLPPLPSSPPSDMLPLRKRVRITPLQTETSEETVDETHTQTTAPTRLCKKSEARRWTFLISKFHIWRDQEVAPSTYKIEESSTANVLLVTGESVHHTVSLVVARLISHTRLIEEIHEHLRVVSLERIETLEQEVETMRDRAKIVCHEDTEARLQQSEAGVIELKQKARILELKRRYFEDYYSDTQYAVSIKEDTAYLCLHSPKTTKDTKPIRHIQERQYAVFKLYGNKIFWKISNVVPTPRNSNTPYPTP